MMLPSQLTTLFMTYQVFRILQMTDRDVFFQRVGDEITFSTQKNDMTLDFRRDHQCQEGDLTVPSDVGGGSLTRGGRR